MGSDLLLFCVGHRGQYWEADIALIVGLVFFRGLD
jgi:hypothetical protein